MSANWPFGDLRPYSYHLQVIDPPWPWKVYSAKGGTKSPEAHYKTMTLPEIAALPVLELARSPSLLLCWGTIPMMHKQLDIVRAWGFVYRSAFVWHKVFPSGKNAVGTGHRVRSMAEIVFVCTLGQPKHKAFPGIFQGVRRDHSQKPREFYQLIETCCPGLTPRADIYARCRRPGWESFGDELDKYPVEHPFEEVA